MGKKKVWASLNIIRSFPAILAYCLSSSKNIIEKDLQRWASIERIADFHWPSWIYLNWFLVYKKEFRNLFYYRIGNGLISKFLAMLYPRLSTLYICTPSIGPGLYISHGFSTIITAKSVGENCWINQQVTVGYGNNPAPPVIGNNVRIGAGAVVIGNITVGDHAFIGAGAVVAKNVAERSVMIGNPAFVLRKNEDVKKEIEIE